MHDLHNLKEMLVKELEEFGKSGTISKGSLETIDKLAHAAKNVCKVMDACEEEKYSNAMGRYSRGDRSYSDNSYRYSGANDNIKGQLYRLVETTSDDRTRDELRRFIDRM